MTWLYKINANNTARYSLGEYNNILDKTLICIGVNPSTATPNNLDSTLKRVKRIAENNSYDNWIMINVYPQRATNPKNLHQALNAQFHVDNLDEIKNVLNTFKNADMLFAYGDLISVRPYLKDCLKDILDINFVGQKLCFRKTKKGNPIHPLYQKKDSKLIQFL